MSVLLRLFNNFLLRIYDKWARYLTTIFNIFFGTVHNNEFIICVVLLHRKLCCNVTVSISTPTLCIAFLFIVYTRANNNLKLYHVSNIRYHFTITFKIKLLRQALLIPWYYVISITKLNNIVIIDR